MYVCVRGGKRIGIKVVGSDDRFGFYFALVTFSAPLMLIFFPCGQ